MLQKTSRRLMAGVVAALALCLPAGADVVFENFEDGQSANLYGGPWYTYASGYDPEIASPNYQIADGVMTMNLAGIEGGGKDQEFAIGTDLKATGVGSEWNGVQSITFRAKGANGLKFNFYLNTLENDAGNWNKHGKQITIENTDWYMYTVNLSTDLSQSPYGTSFTFDKTKVTKLAWSIKKAENSGVTGGTFAIDDIKLIGSIDDPTLCKTCVLSGFGAPTPRVLLNDFSTGKNTLGYYDGHVYSNSGSTVAKGAVGNGGDGVSIDFTVGGTGDKYVGISINLADSAFERPLDASKFTGVYFEYKTTEINKMVFAVVEKSGALIPAGEDFYKNLPPTNGEWKAARVNFAELELPMWAQGRTLDKTQFAMLQFAYKGAGAGTIAIDNIYFLGADKFPEIKYALTYKVNVNAGGSIVISGTTKDSWTDSVAAGEKGPTVTAQPADAYYFEKWDDGVTASSRSDEATADKVFTAIFKPKFTITYTADPNGYLLVEGLTELKQSHSVTLAPGERGPLVTAVGKVDPPYQFKGWSDGSVAQARSDVAVNSNQSFTAEFEEYVAPPQVITSVNVKYTAGTGGSVQVKDNSYQAYADTLGSGDSITVTAVPAAGYVFFRWNDNVTTAARTDRYAAGAVLVEAIFVESTPTDPADPELRYVTLGYSAGDGGKLKEGDGTPTSPISKMVAVDSIGPTITAVPDVGYSFVKWNDGVTAATRADTAKADTVFTAEFVYSGTYTVTYVAGTGGKLSVNNNSVYDSRYDSVVVSGANAAVITAVPDSGYKFVKWSGGSTDIQRFNIDVRANVSDTAIFEIQTAVASPNREIPTAPAKEIATVAPVAIVASEFTAGPNPASVTVNFFRTGRAIKTGKLSVYDASGNVVTTISLNDKGTNGKRIVGSWNLKDNKGRQAANGSYAVKGIVTTKDGTREKVSTIIAVAK